MPSPDDTLVPGLYLVATPIGNLEDITLRAIRILKTCDSIVCEDTRVSQKLLTHYTIQKPLISYHDHNADKIRPKLLQKLAEGQSLALISDAGTPLISDPGYKLVQACQEADIFMTTLPGPSAVLAALTLSGQPPYPFTFLGFFSKKKNYAGYSDLPATLVFFESAVRLVSTLQSMASSFERHSCTVVREISKKFEESRKGPWADLTEHYTHNPPKGEIVLVLGFSKPKSFSQVPPDETIDRLIQQNHDLYKTSALAKKISEDLKVPKQYVYQRILKTKEDV